MSMNEKLEAALKKLDLTEEQKKLFLDGISARTPDKELYDRLKEAGASIGEDEFVGLLKAAVDKAEEAVFKQELSLDEMEAVAGGFEHDCTNYHFRDINNCAATVEDGSRCGGNDACVIDEVKYYNINTCTLFDCKKAWK